MNTLGYRERLKLNDPCSEMWWDSSTVVYAPFKNHLLEKYPAAAASIEHLMPDSFSQARGFCSVTTNPRLVTAVILEKREYQEPGLRSRFSYHPTPAGSQMTLVLGALQQWGDDNVPPDDGPSLLRRTVDDESPVRVAFVEEGGTAVPVDRVKFVTPPAYQ